MKFKKAFKLMLMGKKVGLKEWKGYWKWENDTIMMYCADGTIQDIRETKDSLFTFSNICNDTWEEKTNHIKN